MITGWLPADYVDQHDVTLTNEDQQPPTPLAVDPAAPQFPPITELYRPTLPVQPAEPAFTNPISPAPVDPVVPETTVYVPPSGEPLDSAGFPWDKRIHSMGKTRKNDDTWKLKKGVDKTLVEQVRYEFTAPAAALPDLVTQAAMVEQTLADGGLPLGEQPTVPGAGLPMGEQSAPPLGEQQQPVAPVQPEFASLTSPGGISWEQFLARVNKLSREGRFDTPRATQYMTAVNVKSVPLMSHRNDLWDQFLVHMGA